jgi:predicted CXXCH cytochrome family protein
MMRCERAILGASLILTCGGRAVTSRAAEHFSFAAEQVLVFKAPDSAPMFMPTDVAVAADGTVFVADGANERVVQFDRSGQFAGEIRMIGKESLSRPLGLDVDSQGRLWIADTGNGRIVVRAADGKLEKLFVPPRRDGDVLPELADVAVSPDGAIAWITDNEGHRVLRLDVGTETFDPIGKEGNGPGEFQYPFLLAAGRDEAVFVADTINGRVQRIPGPQGIPLGIGQYGVNPGEFHRPKGVAVDAEGNVWAVDGSLGSIQVFTAEGRFLGVVRDAAGRALPLKVPCGIALDSEGHLFVTDLTESRVVKFRVTRTEGGARVEAGVRAPPAPNQPPKCTVCHLEWLTPFPQSDPPYVSRPESCLTCHDGSVVDSWRRAWNRHGHRSGTTPPPGMTVPPDLPLVDGQIQCRTCHSAHVHGPAGSSLKDAVFLRVKEHPEELCVRCHAGQAGGQAAGNHPTPEPTTPIPEEIRQAGGEPLGGSSSRGCMVCHSAHGSGDAGLLIPTKTPDRLCLACHEQSHPAIFGSGSPAPHPLTARLKPNQRTAVESLHARTLPGGEMTCLSCHMMHGTKNEHLLVETFRESRLCIQCHGAHSAMFGTKHDLRAGAPYVGNARGMTAGQSGPCGACHAVHQAARAPASDALDPDGRCVTCHGTEPTAVTKTPGRTLHPAAPGMTCATCHDPHADSKQTPAFLRGSADAGPRGVCYECHTEKASIDQSFHRAGRLARFEGSNPTCGPCHAVHLPLARAAGGEKESEIYQPLWSGPFGSLRDPMEIRLCTGCHSEAGGLHDIRFKPHPPIPMENPFAADDPGYMPLVDSQGRPGAKGRIGCATCHVSHGREAGGGFDPADLSDVPEPLAHASKSMLRPYVAPNLCSSCHGFEGLDRFLSFHRRPADSAAPHPSR